MTYARLGHGGQSIEPVDPQPSRGDPSRLGALDEALPFVPGVLYRCSAEPSRRLSACAGRVRELFGQALDDPSQFDFGDHVHPDDREVVWEALSSSIAAGRAYCLEYRVLTPDGRERWVEDQGVARRHANGNTISLTGSLVDVTATRKLEEQAARAAAIARLAAGVAHDVNNLQGVIVGCAQLFGRLMSPATAGREKLEEIIDAARRAAILARQLVAFSRPRSERVVALDFNQVIEGMERLLRSVLGQDIELMVDLDPELGTVAAEPSEVEQILLNLVANAKEAMSDGGVVRLSTSNIKLGEGDVAPHAGLGPGKYIRLRVADTGPGIPPEALLRIFEPYFSTKDSTGLGLSTVEGIVRRQGGHVQVHSDRHHGTIFDVLLPRTDQFARVAVSKVVSRRPLPPDGQD